MFDLWFDGECPIDPVEPIHRLELIRGKRLDLNSIQAPTKCREINRPVFSSLSKPIESLFLNQPLKRNPNVSPRESPCKAEVDRQGITVVPHVNRVICGEPSDRLHALVEPPREADLTHVPPQVFC